MVIFFDGTIPLFSHFHCCYWEISCQLNCCFFTGDLSILSIFLLCQAVSLCYVGSRFSFIYPAWDMWFLLNLSINIFHNFWEIPSYCIFCDMTLTASFSHSRNPIKNVLGLFTQFSMPLSLFPILAISCLICSDLPFSSLVLSLSVSNILFNLFTELFFRSIWFLLNVPYMLLSVWFHFYFFKHFICHYFVLCIS